LNQARQAIPTDYHIYIAAAVLEEAQQNFNQISKILAKMLKNLSQPRSTFIQEATIAEIG
jgi:hypothetical protein